MYLHKVKYHYFTATKLERRDFSTDRIWFKITPGFYLLVRVLNKNICMVVKQFLKMIKCCLLLCLLVLLEQTPSRVTTVFTNKLRFNPKQAKGGRNQDAACLDTLPVQQGKGAIIKPPCICHFACPKQHSKFQFRICIKTF